MTDVPATPGQRLQQERERQNLSEQSVADQLHLSLSYLRAIEADDYRRLPEPAFVKGYLRNYARLLGLESEPLVSQYLSRVDAEAGRRVKAPLQVLPVRRSYRWLWLLLLFIAALVGVSIWWSVSGRGSQPPVDPVEDGRLRLPPVSSEAVDPTQPLPHEDDASTGPQGPELVLPPISTGDLDNAGVPESTAPESEAVVATGAEPAPAEPVIDRLTLNFSGECWLEVADANGRRLFQGIRQAGQDLSLEGEAPFKVVLGNAAAVTALKLNGEAQTLPAATGRVQRLSVP